ncbi:hypothetical protein HA402_012302, partial [Bradysia odoriphaga]
MVGFNTPNTVGRYVFDEENEGKRWNIYRTTPIATLNPNDFIATQVWYPSKDGTKVPMFIVRHKDTQSDGTAPAIQYGYGGFTISIDPFFSPAMLTMLKKYGAVLAVPNIRGGGEFGEAWHQGGIRERKLLSYGLFREYLVKHKYAAPGKVAINGGSNGGLLVAACVNRAPEGTFGAAVAEVGVLDLLKVRRGHRTMAIQATPTTLTSYTLFPRYTTYPQIGFCLPPYCLRLIVCRSVSFVRFIRLISFAIDDDRVVPLHSFKHAATLQHMKPNNPHPLLIRIDKKAGHGSGKSTDQRYGHFIVTACRGLINDVLRCYRIKEAADKWGFVVQSNGWVAKQTEAS